jgi:hypothetical protein
MFFGMAAIALSFFHEELRVLLGDSGDPVSGYDYTTAQLDSFLRTAARQMKCMEVDPADFSQLLEAPANADTWAYLVARAAYMKVGGSTPENWRTRAVSHAIDAAARRDTIVFLETLLSELDSGGNVCGVAGATERTGLFAGASDWVTYVIAGRPLADPDELYRSGYWNYSYQP